MHLNLLTFLNRCDTEVPMRPTAWFILLCLLPNCSEAADESEARGWYGKMDIGVRVFRFRVEPVQSALPNDVSKTASAWQLVSLDEGGQVFLLDDFKTDGTLMSFALKKTGAEYSSTRSAAHKGFSGTWKQRGAEFKLEFVPCEPEYTDEASEVWVGNINTLFQKLQLQFRMYRSDTGDEQIFLDSVSQKAGGFKAVRSVDGDQWTIRIDALSAIFTGKLNADQTEVAGTFTQGGIPLDLTLTKSATATESNPGEPRRPQMPKAPFPYATEDVTFRNTRDDVMLAGTLCLPESSSPVPAVVLISGSGPQDRDETLLGHKPFWVIADHLARNGIAVLRYDDRGTNASTGDFDAATSEDFSRDAAAAVAFLKADRRVKSSAIGLIGHSEGGLIAPMLASTNTDVAFIVLLAGTGVNGREILISQGQLISKAAGVLDDATLEKERLTTLALLDAVTQADKDETAETIVADVSKRLTNALTAEELASEATQSAFKVAIEQFRNPWFKFFISHEPGPVLEKVKCPVLALNGEKDVQVDPQLNLTAITAALAKGGNKDVEVFEFANLNHLFQTSTTGGVGEYEQIEETIAPAVLEHMTSWITGRFANP